MTNPNGIKTRDWVGRGEGGFGVVISVYIFYSSEDLDIISMGDEFLVMIGKVCHHILFSFELKHLT